MTASDLLKELEKLKGYRYSLWDYEKSHSVLTIRAVHPDRSRHNVHLSFIFVRYIQMPIRWQEGDLTLASEAEFVEIVKKRMGLQETLETLREVISLFKAESPSGTTYILGNLFAVEYDVEPIH